MTKIPVSIPELDGRVQAKEEQNEEELEINLEDVSPPVPPDGGWAWMVLLGSVMCMFFVDGLSFSFGIILSDLQDSFETTKTKISLAGSLIVGFTLISGRFGLLLWSYSHANIKSTSIQLLEMSITFIFLC